MLNRFFAKQCLKAIIVSADYAALDRVSAYKKKRIAKQFLVMRFSIAER